MPQLDNEQFENLSNSSISGAFDKTSRTVHGSPQLAKQHKAPLWASAKGWTHVSKRALKLQILRAVVARTVDASKDEP